MADPALSYGNGSLTAGAPGHLGDTLTHSDPRTHTGSKFSTQLCPLLPKLKGQPLPQSAISRPVHTTVQLRHIRNDFGVTA